MNSSTQPENTILTFTTHDIPFIKTNGDECWVINRERGESCKYLVCCHSQKPNRGTAFCVGLLRNLRPMNTETGQQRYAIEISAYAEINVPNVWQGWQNPVHYTTLEVLGIDLDSLRFKAL